MEITHKMMDYSYHKKEKKNQKEQKDVCGIYFLIPRIKNFWYIQFNSLYTCMSLTMYALIQYDSLSIVFINTSRSSIYIYI